ncbi:hypothetical protein ACIBBE_42870 [Streptomyces sp. NPDC051644]|uniref:hypothetical protein n=1 Tax=Streptomyces sp. NPDC051644 TaxID=3365666 RepID=UPI00379264E7
MSTSRSYHVRAVLGPGGLWQGSVDELSEVTDAHRSLSQLQNRMRKAISQHLTDTSAEDVALVLETSTGDQEFDSTISEARDLRRRADELAKQARAKAAPVARRLVAAGVSHRDAGTLLGVSGALISGLIND